MRYFAALFLFFSSAAFADQISCYYGPGPYNYGLSLNTDTLRFDVSGHRQTYRGYAAASYDPFRATYTVSFGDSWVRVVVPNGTTNVSVCDSTGRCDPCF